MISKNRIIVKEYNSRSRESFMNRTILFQKSPDLDQTIPQSMITKNESKLRLKMLSEVRRSREIKL
jgi:hypothetical protein